MSKATDWRRFCTERGREALAAVSDGGEHAEQPDAYQLGYVLSALERLVNACEEADR